MPLYKNIPTKLKHGDYSTQLFFAPVRNKDATLNSKILGFRKWSEKYLNDLRVR